VRLMLFERETFEQPPELAPIDRDRPGLILPRPFESASFQPSIVEPEAVGVPVKDFELVAASVAENEEAVGEHIEFETERDHRRQAVN